MLTKYHKSEITVAVVLVCIFIVSTALAATSGAVAKGSTADFARTYPLVMIAVSCGLLSLIVILLGVIGYFLKEKEKREQADDQKMVDELQRAINKYESTALDLYKLNRKLTEIISHIESRVSTLESRCGDRKLICPALNPTMRKRVMSLVDSKCGDDDGSS